MSRAGELIKAERVRAALTQTQLAARSGVPQNVISDYERGKREPSFGAVDVILRAAGAELVVAPVSTLELIQRNRDEVKGILTAGGATNASVFGSVARGEESADSDVDLLVDLAEGTGLFDLLRMQDALERLLRRRVDLVPRAGLKTDVASAALRDAVPL